MENFKDFFDYEEADIDEITVAATGVGKFDKPLGFRRKRKERDILNKGFDNTIKGMCRGDMLCHARRMGLTLGFLQDDDIRKTITSMSLRNKRKFMGVANGTGSGDPQNTGLHEKTKILKTFKNKADGVEAIVAKIDKGFSVVLKDMDSGNTLPLAQIFKTEADAMKRAKEIVA